MDVIIPPCEYARIALYLQQSMSHNNYLPVYTKRTRKQSISAFC